MSKVIPTEGVCELCETYSEGLAVDIGGTGQDDERTIICDECGFRIRQDFENAEKKNWSGDGS